MVAVASILAWITLGKLYSYSSGWENSLQIYIGVITFLLIFIIQRGQNKEFKALHVKLNELIVASKNADNRLLNLEERTENEILEVQKTHREIATMTETNI